MKLTVQCPAKVNLFLSVGPVDGSGYHPIRTVFQAVSLFDKLVFEPSDEDRLFRMSGQVPVENTVMKAWRLAKEYVALPTMNVSLHKRIPVKSGLGGGSSDAAGFLRGLVKMTKGRFSDKEAAEVARAVGSDVPFFLVGGTAKGERYGDDLTPLEDTDVRHLVVAMPSAEVCTASAYTQLDALPRTLLDFPADPYDVHNDFLAVAPQASQEAVAQLQTLGGRPAGLTGSGAAVFAVFPTEDGAKEAASCFPTRFSGTAWACRTLSRKESLWTS